MPALKQYDSVLVDLDDLLGAPSSFLEESFGGLIRHSGLSIDSLRKQLKIKFDEEPEKVELIWKYLSDAAGEGKKHD